MPLLKDDQELHKLFETIISIDGFSKPINKIAGLVYNSNLKTESVKEALKECRIDKIEDLKEEILDMLLIYILLILRDHIITQNERRNLKFLKLIFKIEEGDFYKFKYKEVKETIQNQFKRVYLDGKVDETESIHSVYLQEIFDLSYDQIDSFKEDEVKLVLDKGADIIDLDTATSSY